MQQYLDLLGYVRSVGECVPTRAVLKSTGRKVDAIRVFAPSKTLRFRLGDGFPIVTTKKISFNVVAHELAWFLSGSDNIQYLKENGVTIWDEWASEDGSVGPVYGVQWRRWTKHNEPPIDQIQTIVKQIKNTLADPSCSDARRIILSAWNVADLPAMALPPCHVMAQFAITHGKLSCHMYMRSCDLFLGAPYNIASYALLTSLLAHVCGIDPGMLAISLGDAHIYENHLPQVEDQLMRTPLSLPTLWIDPALTDIDEFERKHVEIVNYRHLGVLRGEVAV